MSILDTINGWLGGGGTPVDQLPANEQAALADPRIANTISNANPGITGSNLNNIPVVGGIISGLFGTGGQTNAVPTETVSNTNPTFQGFTKWLLPFGILVLGVVALSESSKYDEVGYALVILIFIGAFYFRYQDFNYELNKLFGANILQGQGLPSLPAGSSYTQAQ
jgi:hypothetical protein